MVDLQMVVFVDQLFFLNHTSSVSQVDPVLSLSHHIRIGHLLTRSLFLDCLRFANILRPLTYLKFLVNLVVGITPIILYFYVFLCYTTLHFYPSASSADLFVYRQKNWTLGHAYI